MISAILVGSPCIPALPEEAEIAERARLRKRAEQEKQFVYAHDTKTSEVPQQQCVETLRSLVLPLLPDAQSPRSPLSCFSRSLSTV